MRTLKWRIGCCASHTHNQRNWGFCLCFLFLRNVQGFAWNHKRVYRIYRELELNLRIKPKRRLVRDVPQPLAVPESLNTMCSMDFMHDRIEGARAIRLLNIIDDYNGEGLAIEADFSLTAERVVHTLGHVIVWRGAPQVIHCDNGLNTSVTCSSVGRISTTSPSRISNLASLSRTPTSRVTTRTVRYDWLNQYLFDSIEQVQECATQWLWTYNNERPNMGIGGITPKQKLALVDSLYFRSTL